MPVTEEQYRDGQEQMALMGREGTMLDQKVLSEELYELSVGFLFGEIWRRPHLTLRERQLITLAANVALSRPTGAHSHFRSSRHIGLKHEEIIEVMLHVGMYAGWPVIAHAAKQYGEVIEADGLTVDPGKPRVARPAPAKAKPVRKAARASKPRKG